jgi:hypothetical protein
MNNILVIGAGQLGSRHLQGLAKSDLALNITVIEPSASNLEIAISRYKEIDSWNNHRLNWYSSLPEVPPQLVDLAIIATNADVRAAITKQLTTFLEVRYIIFEKVAFQSELQFEEIIQLLKSKSIEGWVNCPRRFFPFYQCLKEYLKGKGPIKLDANGVDWGLACNAVHHIDLLAYLSSEYNYTVDVNQLQNKIYPSKRNNFIEFYGSFSGKSVSGNSFRLNCEEKKLENEKSSLSYLIVNAEEEILINEANGIAEFHSKNNNKMNRTEEVKMIFQSALTHYQVQQILETGASLLPGIEESFEIHRPLLRMLHDQYFKITGSKIEELPIT